jgi:hypothetical protein
MLGGHSLAPRGQRQSDLALRGSSRQQALYQQAERYARIISASPDDDRLSEGFSTALPSAPLPIKLEAPTAGVTMTRTICAQPNTEPVKAEQLTTGRR